MYKKEMYTVSSRLQVGEPVWSVCAGCVYNEALHLKTLPVKKDACCVSVTKLNDLWMLASLDLTSPVIFGESIKNYISVPILWIMGGFPMEREVADGFLGKRQTMAASGRWQGGNPPAAEQRCGSIEPLFQAEFLIFFGFRQTCYFN